MNLEAMLLSGLLALEALPAREVISPNTRMNTRMESAESREDKLYFLATQQVNYNSYGEGIVHPANLRSGEPLPNIYFDGFRWKGHSFGTRLHVDEDSTLRSISFFGNTIFLGDFYGDGVDLAHVFDQPFVPGEAHRDHTIVKKIPIASDGANPYANRVQETIINIIVEKYRTGTVSSEALAAFTAAQKYLLDHAISAAPEIYLTK